MVHKLKPYGGVLVAPACRSGDTCNSIDLARLVRARLPRVLRHEVGHAGASAVARVCAAPRYRGRSSDNMSEGVSTLA